MSGFLRSSLFHSRRLLTIIAIEQNGTQIVYRDLMDLLLF